MADVRVMACAALTALLTACSARSPQQRIDDAELAAVAPLKDKYPGVVMGFDIRPQSTLIVSLDLQHYIETDDDVIAAMKRDALAQWRTAWNAAHPHGHAVLYVRFIDFIGRTVAQESTKL
jgi:hypothetical protein